jgi:predicted lipoprotein with Yx(FWY)xxD motif
VPTRVNIHTTAQEDQDMRRLAMLSPVVLAAALLAGCGSSSSSTTSTAKPVGATGVVVSTKTLPGLGAVLVDSTGRTLYTFAPDKRTKVTCVGACAAVWPPLKLPAGAKATAGSGVTSSMLGSDADPSGGKVVTYNGWPLYTYVADKSAGSVTGQALNSSGGFWYVISPSGTVITKKATSSGGSTTTSTGATPAY